MINAGLKKGIRERENSTKAALALLVSLPLWLFTSTILHSYLRLSLFPSLSLSHFLHSALIVYRLLFAPINSVKKFCRLSKYENWNSICRASKNFSLSFSRSLHFSFFLSLSLLRRKILYVGWLKKAEREMQRTINLNDLRSCKTKWHLHFVLFSHCCSCSLAVVVVRWAIADGAFRIYYYDLKVHKPLEGDSRISLP